jgi:undecaprenyl-diphosphatase
VELIEALALAALQALTEFLPVSSSGHLVVAAEILELPLHGEDRAAFFVWLHVASMLAIVVALWREWLRVLRTPRLLLAVGLAALPAGAAGLTLKTLGALEVFDLPAIAALGWLVTAALLWNTRRPRTVGPPLEERRPFPFGLLIALGCYQAVAILPGVSRSGATIAGGLRLGLSREEAFNLSFLMFLPLMAGAQALEFRALAPLARDRGWVVLGLSFALCFALSTLALAALRRYVRRGRLHSFAPYCLAAGLATLVWLAIEGRLVFTRI